MRNHTFVSTYPVIFRCAMLAAAVVNRQFRAMDVLYYMDYYASMLEYPILGSDIKAQPVQIARALEHYESDGLATIVKSGHKKLFALNQKGTRQILTELVNPNERRTLEELVLVRYILRAYKDPLLKAIATGATLSNDEMKDIHRLFDIKRYVSAQIDLLDAAIRKLEFRIKTYDQIVKFVAESLGDTTPLTASFIDEFDQKYMHRLSHRKSFKELFSEMPAEMLEQELRYGFKCRRENYLHVLDNVLRRQRDELESLLDNEKKLETVANL